jgi:hypothetical protein
MGRREVASMGIASLIHQIAIHEVMAKTLLPSGLRPSGSMKSWINKKDKGPKIRPILLLVIIIYREFSRFFG